MAKTSIDTIMIFAAGRGSRMSSLTDNKPKTLLEISNKPILYHILELINTYQFKRIIINTHYLSKQIEQAVAKFKSSRFVSAEIILINQDEMLENGGAVKNAADYFNDKPIFTINGDVIIKAKQNVFDIMQASWQPEYMDFLLLLQDTEKAVGYKGRGDFEIDESRRLSRPVQNHDYKFMYTGLNILKPDLIKLNQQKKFSLLDYYINPDSRLYGELLSESRWYHANRPQDLIAIEEGLKAWS